MPPLKLSPIPLFIAIAFGLFFFAVCLRYSTHDLNRDDAWRANVAPFYGDEIFNRDRAASIATYSYRENPVLLPNHQQLFLMIGSVAQRALPAEWSLPQRALVALRLEAGVGFFLTLIFSFFLFRSLTASPWIALAGWFFFAGGTGYYFRSDLIGKEDSLALASAVLALYFYLQATLFGKRRLIFASVAAIVVGGSFKQYPLLLIPLAAAFFLTETTHPLSRRLARCGGLLLAIVLGFLLLNPNFVVGKLGAAGSLKTLVTEGGDTIDTFSFSRRNLQLAWSFLRNTMIPRYWLIALVAGLTIGMSRRRKAMALTGPSSGSWSFAVAHRWPIAGFLAFYMGASLYKIIVLLHLRYVLIFELAMVCLLVAALDQLYLWSRGGGTRRQRSLSYGLGFLFCLSCVPGWRAVSRSLVDAYSNVVMGQRGMLEDLFPDLEKRFPPGSVTQVELRHLPDALRARGFKSVVGSHVDDLIFNSPADNTVSLQPPTDTARNCFAKTSQLVGRVPPVGEAVAAFIVGVNKAAYDGTWPTVGPTWTIYEAKKPECNSRPGS